MTAAGRFDRVYQVSPQSDPFLSFYLGKLQPYYSLNYTGPGVSLLGVGPRSELTWGRVAREIECQLAQFRSRNSQGRAACARSAGRGMRCMVDTLDYNV